MEMYIEPISITLSIIALIFSLFNIYYTRKRTKIVDTEAKKRQKFEETSEVIRKVIRRIKESVDFKDFSNVSLDLAKDEIVSYIHDNKLEKLELKIKPKYFELSVEESSSRSTTKNLETLKKAVKTLHSENRTGLVNFNFDCEPDIIESKFVELVGPFSNIHDLYLSAEMLLPYKSVIEAFDISILDELEERIDDILKVIFESLMSEHQFTFDSTKSSQFILHELERKLLDLDSVHIHLIELSNICERLVVIQKEIFLES